LIDLLFLFLTITTLGFGHAWGLAAGYTELAISLLAFYVLAAKYLNSFFGKTMLRVGTAYWK